jgi:hypothetical protein
VRFNFGALASASIAFQTALSRWMQAVQENKFQPMAGIQLERAVPGAKPSYLR